jgi:GDSL-like Lipase/Acylhydrolase family
MLARAILVVFGVVLALAVGETVARLIPRSHWMVQTLAHQLWLRRCWRTDASGFREQPAHNNESRVVVVVGDSFAAGAGICDPRDRFADQLAGRVQGKYRVHVIARVGMDTRDEWSLFRDSDVRADVLVLSYFGNDIDRAAWEHGIFGPTLSWYRGITPLTRWLIDRSYLVNFLFWMRRPWPAYEQIVGYYDAAWSSPAVLASHREDVDRFLTLGVPAVLVLFPFVTEPQRSARYIEEVARWGRARGAHIIDVRDLMRDLPLSRQIVNSSDAHASVIVHHRIGKALAEVLP